MLGYMTAKEAKGHGFTHHASYYGIPLYMDEDPARPMVAAKWAPMEYLMTVFHVIEQTMRPILFPHDDPAFQFKLLRPL